VNPSYAPFSVLVMVAPVAKTWVTTGPVCPVQPDRRGHSLSRPGYGPPPC
jgi:hypothetical protein